MWTKTVKCTGREDAPCHGGRRDQRHARSARAEQSSYLTVVVLAKVITEMEGMEAIVPNIVERFFTADLAFLQDMYQRINDVEPPTMTVVCPKCGEVHEVPINFTREG